MSAATANLTPAMREAVELILENGHAWTYSNGRMSAGYELGRVHAITARRLLDAGICEWHLTQPAGRVMPYLILVDVCAVCHERVKYRRDPRKTTGGRWVHGHANHDIACGTGDGASATPTRLQGWVSRPYPATAGNNKRVHLIREQHDEHYVTVCGTRTPRRPQTTQESLPKCGRCFV
jgi:hypothetical protein